MAKVKAISTPDRFLRRFVFKRNGPDKSRTSSRGFSAFWERKSTQTPPTNGSTPKTHRSGNSRLLRSLSSFITKKRDHKIETNFCEESEPPATPSPVEEEVYCEDHDHDVMYRQPAPSVIFDDTMVMEKIEQQMENGWHQLDQQMAATLMPAKPKPYNYSRRQEPKDKDHKQTL